MWQDGEEGREGRKEGGGAIWGQVEWAKELRPMG